MYLEVVERMISLGDAAFLFSTVFIENLQDIITCRKVSLDQIVPIADGYDHVNAVVFLDVTLGDHRQGGDSCAHFRVHYIGGKGGR